jgi:iron complex outermembrane receptor protein
MWKLPGHQRIWASFSRSTRTPSRVERDSDIQLLGIPQQQSVVALKGNSNFDSERVFSYELGYRVWPRANVYVDLAAFYNEYDDLILARLDRPTERGEIPLRIVNGEKASTYGLELTSDWRVFDWARLQFSYTHLRTDFSVKNESAAASSSVGGISGGDNRDPENQVSLRTSFDLPRAFEFDVWIRYVDQIADITTSRINREQSPSVKSYTAIDLRLGWRPNANVEIAFVGRNLNDPAHIESLSELATFPTQVERSFYGQIKLAF